MSDLLPLLRVRLDGEIVAEATLTVYDAEKTWLAFVSGFPQIAHLVTGEFFNTVRIACDEQLKGITQETGITIDLRTRAVPEIIVPDFKSNGLR